MMEYKGYIGKVEFDDEAGALKNTLTELRMGFVQITTQGPPEASGAEG